MTSGTRILQVSSRQGAYEVHIGRGVLPAAGARLLRAGIRPRAAFVLADAAVSRRWGAALRRGLDRGGFPAQWIPFSSGESSKTLATAERILQRLGRERADRGSLLISFGGGVAGDLAGFVASVYMRGLEVVHVPTTLLAQVDASLGGKTAVNLGARKNQVGTFHAPRAVLSDLDTLGTLPRRELRCGLAEMTKAAVVGDPVLFRSLEGLGGGGVGVSEVLRAARVKVNVVEADECEAGRRRVLNLGHTFGHALESAAGFQGVRHGEAVAIGMVAACCLGERLGLTPRRTSARIRGLLEGLGLPTRHRPLPEGSWRRGIAGDKKHRRGKLTFVVPVRVGAVRVVEGVDWDVVVGALADAGLVVAGRRRP